MELVDGLVLDYFPPFLTFSRFPGFWSYIIVNHLCFHLELSYLSVEAYTPRPTVSISNLICISLDMNDCVLKKGGGKLEIRELLPFTLPAAKVKVEQTETLYRHVIEF